MIELTAFAPGTMYVLGVATGVLVGATFTVLVGAVRDR
jgi:hypothetical protein